MSATAESVGHAIPGREALEAFAAEVGASGPVVIVGGRTQWDVGGPADPTAREVKAPAGVVAFEPEEMIVRCGAGTTVAELDAVTGERGQFVALDAHSPAATVGGVLAVGRSGPRRLRYGPVRDTLLEARYVSAEGQLVRAGGPLVKNVTGFDICRLLVGSLGTVGLMGQVVLRCQPRPEAARWLVADPAATGADPFEVRRRLHRPSSILWDGTRTWVLLEGHPADVEAETLTLGGGWSEVDDGPTLPRDARRSLRPRALADLATKLTPGSFVAEVGVGTVHLDATAAPLLPRPEPSPEVAALNRRVKEQLDPTGRLNPGRDIYA